MKEKMSETNHILIVDNNPIFKAGIRSLLNGTNSGIKIVGEADKDEDVLGLVKQMQPNVVLLDIAIAKGEGEFEILGDICTGEDATNVVVMTSESEITPIIQSLSHGAVGVVTKDVTATELRQAVYRAAQRQRALSSAIVDVLVEYLLEREASPFSYDLTTIQSLTDRELEVFNLLALGLPNKEIADRISLSLGTVKSHTSNIMSKLQVSNRAQVVLLATGRFFQDQNNPKDELD